MIIFGPAFNVARAIGRGLGRRLAVGLGVGRGLAVGTGVGVAAVVGVGVSSAVGLGVADAVGLALAVGLGVTVFEQADTASSKDRIEPIRAIGPVLTRSSLIIDVSVPA
jgi:hypothetical protein